MRFVSNKSSTWLTAGLISAVWISDCNCSRLKLLTPMLLLKYMGERELKDKKLVLTWQDRLS